MAGIVLESLHKTYPGGARALRDVSFETHDGSIVAVVGPSGSGKSTLLRAIAGLEELDSGSVRIGDRVVDGLAPRDRGIAAVFQSWALYPHLDVRGNIEFPLRVRGVRSGERARRVTEVAELLDLTSLLDRRPAELSGGEAQRVAFGRAIVRRPEAFLLDEPFSQLDTGLHARVRGELVDLQRRLGTTIMIVTHDQEEAVSLGGRVAVLDEGSLQQIGSATDIYDAPANRFTAVFFGAPGMNIVDGIDRAALPGRLRDIADSHEGDVGLGFRPERARLEAPGSGRDALSLPGRIESVESRMDARVVRVTLPGNITVNVKTLRDAATEAGSAVEVVVDPERACLFASGERGENLCLGNR